MRRKTLWAIGLCATLPLVTLAWLGYDHLLGVTARSDAVRLLAVPVLLLATAASIAAGAALVWDLGRAAERAQAPPAAGRRGDEVVVGMLGTMEQQSAEIRSLADRLDAAYHELEIANAKLKKFSFRDDVTELYNRRFLLIRLEEEISRHRRFGHPVSVVLLDLDGFKDVNDEFGHDVGDETLRAVGQILTRQSRDINVVGRFGGDEFAILLVETPKAGAQLYAERIRELIALHAFPHGTPLTASLGVASLPEDETVTAGDVLRAADRALYAAKRAGKNRVALAEAPAPRPGA